MVGGVLFDDVGVGVDGDFVVWDGIERCRNVAW